MTRIICSPSSHHLHTGNILTRWVRKRKWGHYLFFLLCMEIPIMLVEKCDQYSIVTASHCECLICYHKLITVVVGTFHQHTTPPPELCLILPDIFHGLCYLVIYHHCCTPGLGTSYIVVMYDYKPTRMWLSFVLIIFHQMSV